MLLYIIIYTSYYYNIFAITYRTRVRIYDFWNYFIKDKYFSRNRNYLRTIAKMISWKSSCICVVIMRLLLADFEFNNQLPTDTFQFGGQTGNTVTQLVFRRK